MPALVLLNGPPAAGKSTLAARLVDLAPLALNLDIDVVRSQLGAWLNTPIEAGLAARNLATSMASAHLGSGRDVVVPQLLGRVDFIEQLEHVANDASATFVEVLLELDRADAIEAFETRRRNPTERVHHDAAALVDAARAAISLGDMYDAVAAVARRRPNTIVVPVTRGDIDGTLDALLVALGTRWRFQ